MFKEFENLYTGPSQIETLKKELENGKNRSNFGKVSASS